MIRTTTTDTTQQPRDDHDLQPRSSLDRAQMRYLEAVLDGPTTDLLSATGPRPGWRCLELGAGGGSIASWMAQRVIPEGEVVAVDLDTDELVGLPGVTALRHDITRGVPVVGPFDLIHARHLLLLVPERREILRQLVAHLAPGGWLVIGDFGARLPRTIPTDGTNGDTTFDRLMRIARGATGQAEGLSLEWAHDVADHMGDHGLVDVYTREHSRVVKGNDTAAWYLHNLATQIEPLLLRSGMGPEELQRCEELLLDPRFFAWFHQFVGTRGRKPDEG